MRSEAGLEDFAGENYTPDPFLTFAPISRVAGQADRRCARAARIAAICSPLPTKTDVTADRRNLPSRSAACLGWLAVLSACAWGSGCVQRRLTIRSNPPGALVRIDNHEIGITPCSTDYIYYGKRHIQLVRDGYETVNDYRWIGPPWYEIPPIDLVTEHVVPWEVRDERIFDYDMLPQQVVPTQQLLGRAENLRQVTQADAAAAARAAPPTPAAILPGPPVAGAPIPGNYPAAPAPLNTAPASPSPAYPTPAYPTPALPAPGYQAPAYPLPGADVPRSYPLPAPTSPPAAFPPLSNPMPYSPPPGYPRPSAPMPVPGPR